MIVITFEDAVNAEHFDFFNSKQTQNLLFIDWLQMWTIRKFIAILQRNLSELFIDDRKNPNGCPIRATFYVSHQYTNYRDVQQLWNLGHEIAVHSVT